MDVAIEFKYNEGIAIAFKGLGICEEKVLNKFEAMGHLETALDKAVEANLDHRIQRDISNDLVRVYQLIAIEYDEKGEAELSL